MAVRIGINGAGRIGRNLWRIVHTGAPDLEVVAVNDTANVSTIANLLRHDSIRGRFPGTVEARASTSGDAIVVDGVPVPLTHEPVPDRIDWGRHDVDVVIEATGEFTEGPAVRGHLRSGAPIVIVSIATPDADLCVMVGINEHMLDPTRHRVISNCCCTTYCIGLMISPLHHAYGVLSATASIAYSHGSRPGPPLDGVYHLRRLTRANAINLVPAGVPGVRLALDQVLPELAGRIAATAYRTPVRAVSAATLTLRLRQRVDADEINQTLEHAATSLLKGYLDVAPDPLVSSDVIGYAESCVVDAGLTTSLGDLVRVVGWYDNEWGYAHRLLDLARLAVNHTQ